MNNISDGSYAQYEWFDDVAYNCYDYLMKNNEMIWKLLYYDTPDAWNRNDLTTAEKASLIYNGQDDLTVARAFMDTGQPDVWTKEICIIRISPHSVFPDNRVVGTLSVIFEVFCHYKTNHLSNYKTRIDMVTQNFIKTFNGVNLGGVGRLFFDRLASYDNRMETGGQLPFKGRWMIMSNKSK
jgi:hypothetical protein